MCTLYFTAHKMWFIYILNEVLKACLDKTPREFPGLKNLWEWNDFQQQLLFYTLVLLPEYDWFCIVMCPSNGAVFLKGFGPDEGERQAASFDMEKAVAPHLCFGHSLFLPHPVWTGHCQDLEFYPVSTFGIVSSVKGYTSSCHHGYCYSTIAQVVLSHVATILGTYVGAL